MVSRIKQIAQENNPAKIGIIISAIIIGGGLLPNIDLNYIKIFFPDTILIFLVGFTSLFYFMSIKINQNESPSPQGFITISTPTHRSPLSKSMYNFSIFLFVLTLIRIIILIIRELMI